MINESNIFESASFRTGAFTVTVQVSYIPEPRKVTIKRGTEVTVQACTLKWLGFSGVLDVWGRDIRDLGVEAGDTVRLIQVKYRHTHFEESDSTLSFGERSHVEVVLHPQGLDDLPPDCWTRWRDRSRSVPPSERSESCAFRVPFDPSVGSPGVACLLIRGWSSPSGTITPWISPQRCAACKAFCESGFEPLETSMVASFHGNLGRLARVLDEPTPLDDAGSEEMGEDAVLEEEPGVKVAVSEEFGKARGLSKNKWSYPPELFVAMFGGQYVFQTSKQKWGHRGWAASVYRGCSHGCRYCYVPAILRKLGHSGPDNVPCTHPDQLSVILDQIRRNPWKSDRFLILTPMSDPCLPGIVLQSTESILTAAAESGIPVLLLTKHPPPVDILPSVAAPGFALWIGTTVTCCSDDDSRAVEPHAPMTSERLRAISAISEFLKSASYPGGTLVSITPIHSRTGSVRTLATLAFESGVDIVAAEILHSRSPWCAEHKILPHHVPEIAQDLISVAEEFDRLVVLKDELRAQLSGYPLMRVRYVAILRRALPESATTTEILAELKLQRPVVVPSRDQQATLDPFLGVA